MVAVCVFVATTACGPGPAPDNRRPLASRPAQAGSPIRLHPVNPHYFLWRGQPTVVITSGEHYGAVLNLDFDYRKYLDTLALEGLNGTRTFVGSYVETEGNFNIAGNTLNPAAGRYLAPWARSSEPGYVDGGNKFDLTRWDEAYFNRFHDFLDYASQKGIIVELSLFTPFYEESMWTMNPMNARNNVNGLGAIERQAVLTLTRSGGLLQVQEALVRKIIAEVAAYDNVYVEICNEPYVRDIAQDWQRHITDIAAEASRRLPSPVLLSQNVANRSARVQNPHPAIGIFNFHYATPPEAVDWNYHLNKVLGENETGFRGTDDEEYRTEAWEFILAGGGLFNNLDYSFAIGHEDGTYRIPEGQPGGGGRTLRAQLRFLHEFLSGFDFIRMHPDASVIREGVPDGGTARVLAEPGNSYAVYLRRSVTRRSRWRRWATSWSEPRTLGIELPAGAWRTVWLDPVAGREVKRESFQHGGGILRIGQPSWGEDVALEIRRE